MIECTRRALPSRRICVNCGRLGHLARTCTAPAKSHRLVGVEIEGFWTRDHLVGVRERQRARAGMSGSNDGSLESDDDDYLGYEFRSAPGHVGEAIDQLAEFYPDGTNSSAGMHVHVSFRDPLAITALYSEEFFEWFRRRWDAWGVRQAIPRDHQFWLRLRGHNRYCKLNDPPNAGQIDDGDRYQQLNFTAWANHKTLECRLLPMFRDLHVAASAVEELVNIYEDWLAVDRLGAPVDVVAAVECGPAAFIATAVVPPTDAVYRTSELVSAVARPAPPTPAGHRRYFGTAVQIAERVAAEIEHQVGATCA